MHKRCTFFLINMLFMLQLGLFSTLAYAEKILNVYAWAGEIPNSLIQKFEKETGIHINFSTYDSNETLYAKLRANKKTMYDVICPSAYYVERMRNQNILTKLDLTQLPNLTNLDRLFTEHEYDPNNEYSVPLVWGTTGIFYNQYWIKDPPDSWKSLWQIPKKDEILLLDDIREVFSMALLRLGYKPDDTNPQHIQEAYQQLLQLVSKIKLFASDSISAIMIDEDVPLGMSWSGNTYKAQMENPRIQYVLPKDGFMIWVDCLSIPKNAPHLKEAHQFINFLLDAQNSTQITLEFGYAIPNRAGKALLPPNIRDNATIFPANSLLKKGYFQRDVGEETIELYNHYWEEFKLAF